MQTRDSFLSVFFLFICVLSWAKPTGAQGIPRSNKMPSSTIPLSTRSLLARNLFEKGIANFVNQKTEAALQSWRSAAEKDPNCAVIQAFISFTSKDPREESTARFKAKRLAGSVTPGERLLIKWMVNAREDKYVASIVAMNDLVAKYKDKWLLYIASDWLMRQGSYDRARELLQRALTLDPNYPPALNHLAYTYAAIGDFQHAFAAMERCLTVLPNEPNPQSSYAEILRKGGNFRGALDHYRAALKMDPSFALAQVGIADTYALMGDEETARKEYTVAVRDAANASERIRCELQSALTYVREGKHSRATGAFEVVAEHARDVHLGQLQAQAYRLTAMYQTDDSEALRFIDKAETALPHGEEISQSDIGEERAKILEFRAIRSAALGKIEISHRALEKLSALADESRNANIQRAYHVATGSVLVQEHEEADAIPHLEEDIDNPFSMQRLVVAYRNTGAADKANALEFRIAAINEPTVEQALIVPELRLRLAAIPNRRRTWWSKMVSH